eukprot:GILI01004313.1.p1 GENE.GILI01004313.1~~GILI01004313.1.p1  ORF type:complete len:103 (+),score=22.25 GILI01004313.1:49-357(+)
MVHSLKVWFVNTTCKLARSHRNYPSNKACFRFPPSMTKVEIAQYLKQLYNLNVQKVNTMNYEPVVKRHRGDGSYYRSGSNFKKAIVTLDQEVPEIYRKIYTF